MAVGVDASQHDALFVDDQDRSGVKLTHGRVGRAGGRVAVGLVERSARQGMRLHGGEPATSQSTLPAA
ncbi:MAG: hypothetical protein ACRDWI_19310 [Jiangellaceae bacterium]